MKALIILILTVLFTHKYSSAQTQNSNNQSDSTKATILITEAEKTDVETKQPNAVIQTNVNKDGVIEITKKEFDKIPFERQEMIKKDKNYKVIEDEKH
jgi:high-affinity K+ transport system ATPase subunit B